MATILTKRSNTASSVPVAGDLTNSADGAELAVNTADKRLFAKNAGGTVVELGNNPSSLTLPNGTNNGVAYLNGSKVLTTGSALVFDGSNLGLGVTPSAWGSSYRALQLSAGSFSSISATDLRIYQNGYDDGGGSKYVSTNAASLYRQSGASHIWYNAPSGTAGNAISFTQAMTLDASGNLGVGTTAPTTKVHVVGLNNGPVTTRVNNTSSGSDAYTNVTVANNVGDVVELGIQSSTRTTSYPAGEGWIYASNSINIGNLGSTKLYAGGSERARIDSSGNLLVGATGTLGNGGGIYVARGGANIQTLTTNSTTGSAYYIGRFYSNSAEKGYIYFDGTNVSYTNLSDYRLKENVAPMQNALEKIAALKPVTYTLKSNGKASQGFIAHELQAVVPDAVVGEKDAVDAEGKPVYQGIDTSFLVATLTAAIQEQQAIIDAQSAALEQLKAQLTSVSADVAALKQGA